jgi:hypothetical protein
VNKQFVLPAALLLALGATTPLSMPSAFAQSSAAPPTAGQPSAAASPRAGNSPGAQRPQRDFDFAANAEARIAYVKAKLKVTPAQEAAFDKYAQVIRDNAASMQKSFRDMHGQRGQIVSAIDRVEQRAKFAQLRDQQQQQYLGAFRPLYAGLSAEQKKVADELATPHRHFGRFGHGGGPRRG